MRDFTSKSDASGSCPKAFSMCCFNNGVFSARGMKRTLIICCGINSLLCFFGFIGGPCLVYVGFGIEMV